jgi:hypothetical protein
MRFDLFLGHEKVMQLVVENPFNILNGDFVPALRADVFGGAGKDIHLLAAPTVKQPGEQMDGLPSKWLLRLPCVHSVVAFFPQFFGHDRLNGTEIPFGFWFGKEFARAVTVGVIGAIQPLRCGVLKQPQYRRVAELAAVPGAVAGLIQKPGDAFHALVLRK